MITNIQIQIKSKPISVNSAYMTIGRFRVLTPEARSFKAVVAKEVLTQLSSEQLEAINSWDRVKVVIEISSNWLTKSGSVRKKDVASFEKLLTDAIFSSFSIDDSQIFELTMNKVIAIEELITYSISKI